MCCRHVWHRLSRLPSHTFQRAQAVERARGTQKHPQAAPQRGWAGVPISPHHLQCSHSCDTTCSVPSLRPPLPVTQLPVLTTHTAALCLADASAQGLGGEEPLPWHPHPCGQPRDTPECCGQGGGVQDTGGDGLQAPALGSLGRM
jgi:hypothetical protein